MGESNPCRKSFYCAFAVLVVSLAFLMELLVVGLFFVLPYYEDCSSTVYVSPLQLSSCLTNHSHFSPFILPPTCKANDSLTVQYCFEPECHKLEIGCIPDARCCCRSIPQTRTVACKSGVLELSYNASCAYAVCESTSHTVLLQVYDSSYLNKSSRVGIPGLFLQFGSHTPEATDSNGTTTLNGVYEGDYAIGVLANDKTSVSTEYFHSSTLSINFYSPSQVVYIVYVKTLDNTTVPSVLDCNIFSNQSIHTTEFNHTLSDLLTLPNNFIFNGTFFLPDIVAYTTTPQASVSINISCNTSYTLFYFTREGRWITDNITKSEFVLSTSVNAVLWSLSIDKHQTAYTVYIHPGTSPFILDRGSVLILTNGWFVSRVTSQNRTTLSVPVSRISKINILYTTSGYSHVIPAGPVVELGSLSSIGYNNNCSNSMNTHYIVDSVSAVLSVTNPPNLDSYCYHPISVAESNSIQNVTFAISLRTDTTTVYFSTLQTNTYYACLPYPCAIADYLCEISATNQGDSHPIFNQNCTVAGNYVELLECNTKLQIMKSQS